MPTVPYLIEWLHHPPNCLIQKPRNSITILLPQIQPICSADYHLLSILTSCCHPTFIEDLKCARPVLHRL